MLRCLSHGLFLSVESGTDEASDIRLGWDHSVVRAEHRRRAASSRFVGHDGNYL
jgi:hypothetical protein